jgi:hypothetical protein
MAGCITKRRDGLDVLMNMKMNGNMLRSGVWIIQRLYGGSMSATGINLGVVQPLAPPSHSRRAGSSHPGS